MASMEEMRKKALEDLKAKAIDKELSFRKNLNKLQTSTPTMDKTLSEGFSVPVGNPRDVDANFSQPVQSAEKWKAKTQAQLKPESVSQEALDYKQLQKEYRQKRKQENARKLVKRVEDLKDNVGTKQTLLEEAAEKAKKVLEKGTVTDDFMRKLAKGSKAIGGIAAIPAALLAGRADQALADAVIPGGLEGAGEGSDMPMQDETPLIEMQARSAVDPNLRRMAIQELRNRSR